MVFILVGVVQFSGSFYYVRIKYFQLRPGAGGLIVYSNIVSNLNLQWSELLVDLCWSGRSFDVPLTAIF